MSKNNRGKGLIEKHRKGRGVCPICKRTGVKVVREKEIDKQKVEICKICLATLNKKETLLKKQANAANVQTKVQKVEAAPKEEIKETVTEVKTEPKTEETTIEATEKNNTTEES